MKFEVMEDEVTFIKMWLVKIKPKVLKKQKKMFKGNEYALGMIAEGEPYYGTSGGPLIYHFYGSALGDFLEVEEISTGLKLDVTREMGYKYI